MAFLANSGAVLAMIVAAAGARAAETALQVGKSGAEKMRDLGLAGGSVEAPGLGRVLLAFVLVAALAWGATWVLKRYGFRGVRGGQAGAGPATPIRALARGSLPGGIACHVVETQGRQVLITVSRHGVSSLVLGDASAPVAPAADLPAAAAPASRPT